MSFHIDAGAIVGLSMLSSIVIMIVLVILWGCDVIGPGRSDRVKQTRISFERFQAMYAISPDKWDLGDHNVSYLLSDYGSPYSYYKDFAFSLRDRMRYRGFLREIKKKKKMAAETEEMERIIRSWQDDIEKYKETANMDIRNAVSWAQKAMESRDA